MNKVNLFVTCLMDALFTDTAQAVVNVLQSVGYKVHVPKGQTCCGQPAFNAGFQDDAKKMARCMIDVFYETEGPVVIASGSCGAMIKHHYPDLFADDPVYGPKSRALSERVFEFTQFLVDIAGKSDIGARFNAKVVYHPSCHTLRGMDIDRQPRELLKNIQGLELLEQEHPETCCGFGGVFAVKRSEVSGAMLQNRIRAFEATGADYVIGCDISCLMHIEGGFRKKGSKMRTKHIAQLLAEGLSP